MAKASSKILVIRLSSLGDLILMIPMLSALRKSFREGELVLLTKEKYAGLLMGNDLLDRLILMREGGMRELLRLRSELSRERFDIIIDAHNVIRSNILFHTLSAREKLQIHKSEIAKILLIRGKTNLYKRIISQSGRYARLAERLGAETNAGDAELPISDGALANAESVLAGNRRAGLAFIAFAPGARWQTKVWPPGHFVRLIESVSAQGYAPVLIGGAEDTASNAELAKRIPSSPLDLTGTLSIIETAAVLKKCAVLVTNDSAPLHLAEAVGTPVVAFFGPTVREFGYFPRLGRSIALEVKLPCRPCSRNGARACPYGTKECLTAIAPEEALGALLAVLEKGRASHDGCACGTRRIRHGDPRKAGALMNIQYAVYNALLPVASLAARIAAPFNAKIADGLKGREGFKERWQEQASALGRTGHLIWFHVSSVGEFEQAKPVLNLLAEKLRPAPLELALTFYSPSGMQYYCTHDRSKKIPAIKFLEYLPVDTAGNVRFCLDVLKPDMLVFVKFDLWPNLIIEASRRTIPLILISGTLSPDSHRLSWVARRFYGSLYSKLSGIAAISQEDAQRFMKDLRGAVEIIVAGDTRFDQVCRRIDSSTVKPPGAIADAGARWIIAGSTWPKDEDIVIPGFARLKSAHPEAGLILVPHEPTKERLKEIGSALEKASLSYRLLSSVKDNTRITESVVVADGVGYLAELYRCGTIAYVGGSFTTGVHNVMEPAVIGLPILFGPRIDNSYEARKLADLGSAQVVTTSENFAREIGALLADRTLLAGKGRAAAQFIRNHCGAAVRCVDLMEKYLNRNR